VGTSDRGHTQAARQRQHRGGHAQVHEPGRDHGAREPEPRDQPEAAQVGAQHRAQGVGGVEDRAPATQALVALDEAASHHRQRGPHRDRGRQQHQRGRAEADGRHHQRLVVGAHPAVEAVEALQQGQREQREGADAELEQRVEAQRALHPPEPPGGEGVAQRHAPEEDRQHRADRLGGGPEGEAEHPDPDHLVDEGSQAGEDETADERKPPRHSGSFLRASCVPARIGRGPGRLESVTGIVPRSAALCRRAIRGSPSPRDGKDTKDRRSVEDPPRSADRW
jgi:hypothetical protein